MQRVGLIVVGLIVGFVLREFGVPLKIAAIIGMIPFGLAEAKNLSGPYEKSAHEIMHEQDDRASKLKVDNEPRA